MRRSIILLVMILGPLASPFSQEMPPQESLMPEEYQPEEFPTWTQDLRRFEVITFGSFPITFFATSLLYDFSIYASNDFDPVYSMGTQRTKQDIAIIMGSAAGASLLIGVIDMIINISQRKSLEKQSEKESYEQ